MRNELSQDIVKVIKGTMTEADVAAKHGLSAEAVSTARSLHLAGLADAGQALPVSDRRWRAVLGSSPT